MATDTLFPLSNYSSTVAVFNPERKPIISDELREWITLVMDFIILFLGLLGMVTNGINIRVFAYQGLSTDSSAIGLCALAIADLFGSLFLIPHMSLCNMMRFAGEEAMALSCHTFLIMISGAGHLSMARISSWLTMYIASERCLCVLMPFKVKTLLRPRITAISVVSVYAFFVLTYIPILQSLRVRWGFSADINATIALETHFKAGPVFLRKMGIFLNIVVPLTSFIIVALATGLMLFKLNQFKKWRQGSASIGKKEESAKGDKSSSKQFNTSGQGKKDIEVLKMTLVVTSVFLICLSASLIPGITTALLPFSLFVGDNKNLFLIFYSYRYIMDLINSSVNFFFYLRISTKYKTAFNAVFKGQ